MDSLYLLLPLSVMLGLLVLGVLGWAIHRGQFEHLDQEGLRILEDDAPAQNSTTASTENNKRHPS